MVGAFAVGVGEGCGVGRGGWRGEGCWFVAWFGRW